MVLDPEGREILSDMAECPVCGQQYACRNEEEAKLAMKMIDDKLKYILELSIKATYERFRKRCEGVANDKEEAEEADAGK